MTVFLKFKVDAWILVDIFHHLCSVFAASGPWRFQLAVFGLDKSLLAIDTEVDSNEIIHYTCKILKIDFVEADGSFEILVLFYLSDNLIMEISGVG